MTGTNRCKTERSLICHTPRVYLKSRRRIGRGGPRAEEQEAASERKTSTICTRGAVGDPQRRSRGRNHACCMLHAVCLLHACCMRATCLLHAFACSLHASCMLAACLLHVCCMLDVWLLRACLLAEHCILAAWSLHTSCMLACACLLLTSCMLACALNTAVFA